MKPREKDELVNNPSEVELIKDKSRSLRGTLVESLKNSVTGAVAPDDTQISKFHGIYQQDDRDIRNERQRRHLEPAWSFMIRVRVPAGRLTAAQWFMTDRIATEYGVDHFKLTTRQAVQFHGIIKGKLRDVMQSLYRTQLDSIATCGDVNRNVMCTPVPWCGSVWDEIEPYATKLSEYLLPKTTAWHEIWLDGKKLDSGQTTEEEPLYGKHYLPRKFKTNIAIPPYNDTDIFANDLGFIAIVEGDRLQGFNITVGGGLGMSHSVPETHPCVAKLIGFCSPDKVLEVAQAVLGVQRDYGNRHDRKLARMKYTVETLGVDRFTQLVEEKLGAKLEPTREFEFIHNNDTYGWFDDWQQLSYRTLYVEYGRVCDNANYRLKSALFELAAQKLCDFRLTGNQNLVLGRVRPEDKAIIDGILADHGVEDFEKQQNDLVKHSLACVALPTCPLAMAEAERYLPSLIEKIQALLDAKDIKTPISIRMTGCPNGCARPYLAEIGFVGKSEKTYNLHLGGSRQGERLNVLYRENLHEQEILETLADLFTQFSQRREKNEFFGDWIMREKIVVATGKAQDFHHVSGAS